VEHFEHLLERLVPRQDAIDEVGPVEVADQYLRVGQAELGDDVAADALGGSGRVGVDRGAGEMLLKPAQLAVFGTEVMAPVADAVGLINGEGADALPLEE